MSNYDNTASFVEIAQHLEDWDGDLWAQASVVEDHISRIVAALRAVEAVRALAEHWETWQPTGTYPHPLVASTYFTSARQSAKALRAALEGGVEAVQALLEGEK